MGKLIKRGLSGMIVERTGPYNTTIYLEKDPTGEEAPASQFKIWTPGTTPEERMDQTVQELTPRINPFTNKLVRSNTYQPTWELRQVGTGTEHPTSWVDYVAGLGPLIIPAVVSSPYWAPAAATTVTSPAFWTNVATKTIPNLIKDTGLFIGANAASEATTNKGVGAHVNNAIGLEEDHPIGEFIGFGGVSALRQPLEKAGVAVYQGIRGAILPEYTLSLAMNLTLWKPYVSRIVGENGKIRLRLPGHTDATPREVVLEPQGDNKFYVHVRTWNDVDGKVPANLTPREIGYLYEALYDELPEGAEILFPQSGPGNYATRGTVAGLQRLARDPRYNTGSPGILLYIDKDGSIKEFTGNSFIKTPTTPSRAITYKGPTYPLYYKNKFNFPGLELYNYGVLPVKDTAIRPLQHMQGKLAVQMFKEYGGVEIPDNLPIKKELLLYAKEARVRYGIEGNTEITDQEIAKALYKHLLENNTIQESTWGPLVGFRGTTSASPYIRTTYLSPIEYAESSGTMDNSLGKLFLGQFPRVNAQYPRATNLGFDRYLVTGSPYYKDYGDKWIIDIENSGTGSGTAINIPKSVPDSEFDIFKYFLYLLGDPNKNIWKVRPLYVTTGVNNIDAFMFRTPNYRNITNEMQVGEMLRSVDPKLNFNWLTEETPRLVYEGEEGFPMIYWKQYKINPLEDAGVEHGAARKLFGEQYLGIHNMAQKNNLGLYVSYINSPFRMEHSNYLYLALPQWNLLNAKHILPYDLRLPRLWGDPNVYLKAGGKLVKRRNNLVY